MEIVWAPEEIGGGRRFRVIVSADSPAECVPDAAVEIVDRTAPAVGEQRFYFRAGDDAGGNATIRFQAGADEISVDVRIVPEADWAAPTTRGEIELPRIWRHGDDDIGLKSERTIATEPGSAAHEGEPPPRPEELDWSDDELWGHEPPCDIPRWHFLNLDLGCPVHGLAIYESDAYYPWIVDVRNRPYQVQCPVGGEWYPTNDYAAGDHTSGEFPDDGWGWPRPQEDGSTATFGFISYWLLRRIRDVYAIVGRLSAWYEATGDVAAVRKIGILLASLAREHRYLCRFPEHRFRRYECTVEEPQYKSTRDTLHGPRQTDEIEHLAGSGMDEYCINMPGCYSVCTRAYDLIFDRIDGDAELISFVRSRMPELVDGPAIRSWIETFLFRAGAQVGLDDAMQSNLPEPQRGMLSIIRVLDMPQSAELGDWLVNGNGRVGEMPANYYYKDGAAYESTGGYNGHHVSALVPIADGLQALRERYPKRYAASTLDLFGSRDDERYRDILRGPVELVVAQLSHPFIGDTGDIPHARALLPMPVMPVGNAVEVYRHALAQFPEDAAFRAVLEALERKDEITRRAEREQGAATGFYSAERPPEADIPPDPALYQPSRLLDGYGVGILESGARDLDGRRGAWLYYGDHPGHSHEQQLDIGLFAHRRNLVRHMGYPYSWQHMGEWDGSWITHHTVQVIGEQTPWWRTTVSLFHGGDSDDDARPGAGIAGFQVVESAGYGHSRDKGEEGVEPLAGHTIRRALCLVDVPSAGDDCFYVVDLLKLMGGREHWWTFHGPPGDLDIDSATLTAQDGGTVAGAGVPYGGETPDGVPESLAYLYDVRRGEGAATATWSLPDADGLKLRVTQVTPGDGEVVFARGRSPHALPENPAYELDWMLRHCVATSDMPLDTWFTTLIEAGKSPAVEDATPITVEGVSGVRLRVAGMTHHILRAEDPSSKHEIEAGLVFGGDCAFVERDDTGLRRAALIGEGTLTLNGKGIVRGARDWLGTVSAIDVAARTIDIEADGPPPDCVVGSYLLVSRLRPGEEGQDTFAYRVEAVTPGEPGRWRCSVNWSPRIGEGAVSKGSERGFTTDTQLPLATSRAYFRYAHVVFGDGETRARIADVRSHWRSKGAEVVLHGDDRNVMSGVEHGTEFAIEEIGPGDSVRVPGWAEVARREDSSWVVASSGPAEVDLA